MTAQETLSEYVDKYLRLSSRYGPNSKKTNDVFGKLKDIMILELYFMKSIQVIVHEEELSGFVLYVENYLRDVVDTFRSTPDQFPSYFKHIMEFRAFSYLKQQRRMAMTEKAYEKSYVNYVENVAEQSPEDLFIETEERTEIAKQKKKLAEKLRFVCSVHPSRRRNLFIYLCTLMPHLPSDIIDDFCSVLNFDRVQTFAIADYLCSIYSTSDYGRSSISYYKARKDYLWMRIMELEYSFDNSCNHDERLRDELSKYRMKLSKNEEDKPKMNLEYPILGKILNLNPTRIAAAVYYSKQILSLVLGNDIQSNYLRRQNKGSSCRKSVRLDKMEPFKVFGIKTLKLPVSA